jgi:predicted DNA-binding antitoxin AbrB/MazE fold protein
MLNNVKAVYHKGVFVPLEPCNIPEGLEVELIIHGAALLLPPVKDVEEKKGILRVVVERMQQNPIPTGTPRLTREALHERR